MSKTLINFAMKHKLSLGREAEGYYFIRNPQTLEIVALSNRKTVHSGMIMMRRFVKRVQADPKFAYWR